MFKLEKILVACHQFFPKYYTGTETLTLDVAEELKKRQYEVAVITIEPQAICSDDFKPYFVKDIYQGILIYRLYISHAENPIERLERESCETLLRGLYFEVLQDFAPDIVHSFHLMRLTLSFVDCVKKMDILHFLTVTDFWLMCPTYQLLRHGKYLCTGPEEYQCFGCCISAYQKRKNPKGSYKLHFGKKISRVACVVSSKADDCRKKLSQRIVRNKLIMELLDGVIWANEFSQEMFHRNGFENQNEYVISFPIPEKSKDIMELDFPVVRNKLKVAFIGTLRYSKGPQVLLQACKLLKDEENIEVYIWGESESESNFKIELENSVDGMKWVHFCGSFPQEKFSEVLKDIHVVVIPSLWYENTPLTALSALAAKRILIVSDLGGLSSLVENGISGFVFPAGDAHKLALILKEILEKNDVANAISKNIVSPISVESYVNRLLKIYYHEGRRIN